MRIAKLILTSTILLSLALIVGCKDDDSGVLLVDNTEAERLANTWIIGDGSSVKRDGDDLTSKFVDFSLRFTTNGRYTVQGDPENVIFTSGSWKFVDDTESSIYLNGDGNAIAVGYQGDNDEVLILSFTVSENSTIGGRISGINGEYEFVLSKK